MSKINETKQAENVIKAINKKQENHTVKYTDYNGKSKSRKVELKDPGTLYGLHAVDLMDSGNDSSNYIGLYEMVLNDVIVNPKLSFEKQDKDIPTKLKTKELPAVNRDGKHVTLHMKFPGTRTAVDMIRVMAKPSGASNMVGTIKALDANVFKDSNGRSVSADYWGSGHTGNGLAINAIQAANVYLAKVLDFNGFSSAVEEGISFLIGTVRQS